MKIFGIIVSAVLVAVTGAAIGLHFEAAHFIREKLITQVRENCASCTLTIGAISPGVFFNSVTFEDIVFHTGNPKATAVDAQIPSLRVNAEWTTFLKSVIHIDSIVIDRPQVEVFEGDLKTKDSESEAEGRRFVIEEIQIRSAHFTYTREHKGRLAPIHVDQIQGQIGRTGNTKDLADQQTVGEVKAILENSGLVRLKVGAYLFKKPLDVDVDLELSQQPLQKMNPYFETNDRVVMAGRLIEGVSLVLVRGPRLNASVRAKYEGLDISFKKSDTRTALSAFFSTLVGEMKLHPENTDARRDAQIRHAEIKRNPGETILSFIFRGMKEASLKVASAHH